MSNPDIKYINISNNIKIIIILFTLITIMCISVKLINNNIHLNKGLINKFILIFNIIIPMITNIIITPK